MSSRTLQKSIAAQPGFKSNDIQSQLIKNGLPVLQKQAIVNLKKIKSIEENSLLSTHQLYELKKRIEALEAAGSLNEMNEDAGWNDSGEDWEKLYYETRREKQSLEDTLKNIKDALKENMNKLQDLEKGQAAMKSNMESGINEIRSLQNIIEELQRKLEGGMEREKELAQEVAYEKSRYIMYELVQKENNQLHSEIEMLTSRLEQIRGHNNLMEEKIKSLTELGSILEISEYEKMGIKNSVEQLLHKM